MPALKPQYEAFCRSYVDYPNATEAAREAGYAFESAAQQGYRLLRKPKVVARIAALRAEVVARECCADALMAKLDAAYSVALGKELPAAAARIVEAQAKVALQLAKAGHPAGVGTGEALPAGAEPTRAALTRIARQLGVDGPAEGNAGKSTA